MLFPARWTEVRGFWSALLLPNVLPRYVHFILASIALTGLFIVWLFRRAPDAKIQAIGVDRETLVRSGYRWALIPTLAQFVVGPTVLLTVPGDGRTGQVIAVILAGAVIALPAIWLIVLELRSHGTALGRRFWPIVSLLTITVLCMGSGRHLYREATLAPHQAEVRALTDRYMQAVDQAAHEARP